MIMGQVKRPGASGTKNHNWRGGRVVASNGYVLVKVGFDHPMADVRGYAYEHRLVMAKMLGRDLAEGEQVHHKNGIKTDNRPENLELMAGIAEHRLRHRRSGAVRRLPGEPNLLVECECGCGGKLAKYDAWGRPRRFITGHNAQRRA